MKIERIYILSHVKDIRWARCCVASIRRWYPEIPISLIKDEYKGTYSTEDFERYWNVDIYQIPRKRLGYGFGKLEPLFEKRRQRCFIMDSDIVFLGRVLDPLEQRDDTFIVEESTYSAEHTSAYFLDPDKLKSLEPAFHFPGYVFNTGQFVATSGILTREDFAPYVTFTEPAQLSHGEVFKAGDQGILNFTLVRKAQAGEITLSRAPMMRWPVLFRRQDIVLNLLKDDSPYPFLLHWAGPKQAFFTRAELGHVLSHFEAAFYARIPNGRLEHLKTLGANLMEVVRRQRPWLGYP
jgi:hypothetical protein